MWRALLVSFALVALEATRLIERSLAGDRKATHQLINVLTPVIRRRAAALLRKVFAPHQIDDLVQEVWISLLADDGRVLRGYDGRRSLETYVGVVARRSAKDVVRKEFAEKRGGGRVAVDGEVAERAVGTADHAGEIEARQLGDKLFAHLESTLSPQGRIVMRSLYADGRSAGETAKMLDITGNAVHIWQHKIRKAARVWYATAT